jgi:hypothetical protein
MKVTIVRFYQDEKYPTEIVKRNVSLERRK